ncbi:exodeoxyribonuclease III [Candidatus Parcubacteria bacterium]|nr:exodeoxyribonuclease III [Candidatus Parcubacteria bacterium]
MQIITWNINGIRSAIQKGLLGFIKKENPDVLCLQEIKSQVGQIPPDFLISLKNLGYLSYFNPSSLKNGHSGTAVLTKIKPNQVKFKIGLERFNQEGRVIICEFDNFTLFNFYMTHGDRTQKHLAFKLKAYDFLANLFKKELLKTKNIVLTGDFNIAHQEIDLARPKDNQKNTGFTLKEREKIDKLLDAGFLDSFRCFNEEGSHYTWWSHFANARERNIGWRIDYCFVSKTLKPNLKKAFILPHIMGSDHCPLGVEINV